MSRRLTAVLPDELMDRTEALARSSGRTKGEVVCAALCNYVTKERWRELLEYGRERAERAGLRPEGVEALIDELRAAERAGASR